jgi:hypothetical protein
VKIAHNRAFKEWAIACEALKSGEQTLLIRKGGVREEGGGFRMEDSEFFLLPTYEHQNARLLREEYLPRLEALQALPHDPAYITIDSYAVVTEIHCAANERQVGAIAYESLWNDTYIAERFNYNPYDPLFLLLLRVYSLPKSLTLPMRAEYGGCKSWVTLECEISLDGATPALTDAEFAVRSHALMERLKEYV